jgi:hypothetical protein
VSKYFGIALAIGSLAISGCTETIFKPFDADKGSVSMDARQRTILSVERGTQQEPHRIVCAEPSPDALATIAATAGLSAGVSGLPHFPGKAELASSFASGEQAAMIGARNSTIQLLRDGLYRACEAYMNGALGDFGYGLVLVNYGRVMVALLTADGLVHPALVQPVVIGSTPGKVTTQAKAAEGKKDASASDATGVAPAAGPAGDGSAEASTEADAATAVSAGSAPTPIKLELNDQAEHIFQSVVLPLANPTQDPTGKLLEVTVACMLWLDSTGLKRTDPRSSDLQTICSALAGKAPELVDKFAGASATKPPALIRQARG